MLVVSRRANTRWRRSPGAGGRRGGGGTRPREIGAWLHIGEDGTITVFTGKVEVGQNIRTSLTQAVAEELRAPMSSIRLVMADTALAPYDAGTFGSRTTPDMAPQLRRVAAAAREALLDLAAEQQKVERGVIVIAGAKIKNSKTGESFAFGQLTKGQKLMKAVADNVALTPATKWKVAGTPVPKGRWRDFVTGKHQYTSDIKLPGMLHGKSASAHRPYRATLASFDAKDGGSDAGRDGRARWRLRRRRRARPAAGGARGESGPRGVEQAARRLPTRSCSIN